MDEAKNSLTAYLNKTPSAKARLQSPIGLFNNIDKTLFVLAEAQAVSPEQKTTYPKAVRDMQSANRAIVAMVNPDGAEASDLVEDMNIATLTVTEVGKSCSEALSLA